MALAFAGALVVAVQLGKEVGIETDDISDLSILALVSGLIGARLMFVLVEWDQFAGAPRSILLRRDGFVFYGGLLLATPSVIWFIKRKNIDVRKAADVFAPALALGHSIGRLGCFAQGCCYGRPFDYGLTFPLESPPSYVFGEVPIHPTQLYESLTLLFVFGWLINYRTKKRFDGEVFLIYLVIYSTIRFGIEFLRADDRGFYMGQMSVSQLVSLLIFSVSLVLIVKCRKASISDSIA